MSEVQLDGNKVVVTSPSALAAFKAFDAPVLSERQANVLLSALSTIDKLMLEAEITNDKLRSFARLRDEDRLNIYATNRTLLLQQRRMLQDLYTELTGESPWEDVPF